MRSRCIQIIYEVLIQLKWFNHNFQPQAFNSKLFNYKLFNRRLFNHEFFNHGVEKFMVEKSGVKRFGVEKSEVEMSSESLRLKLGVEMTFNQLKIIQAQYLDLGRICFLLFWTLVNIF